MKFFKKALVASAILGSVTAANAATVSSTPLKLSAEGVMYGVPVTASKLTFDIVVDKDHPSASTITLSFDSNVDLNGLTCAGSVTQGVSAGRALCGDIGFDYGTGSFTFDNVVVTDGDASKGETDSISFDVNLGNPLYADSAFRIVLGNHGYNATSTTVSGTNTVLVKGASTLSYASEESNGTEIETGSGVIATEQTQFGFSVTQDLDGIIERVDKDNFVDAVDAPVASDLFKYTFTNNAATMGLALDVDGAEVNLAGDFEGVETWAANATTMGTLVYSAPAGGTTNEVSNDLFGGAGTPWMAADEKVTVTFTNGAAVIPVTGDVTATAVVTSTTNAAGTLWPTGGITVDTDAAGEWQLDATIINVPYFPVGYTGTSTSVHFANESNLDADVIVTAIDNNGTEYGPLPYTEDFAKKTVTKVSQGKIMSLFGITEATKLSVTFNINADDGDVNAYAYTQKDSQGRSEISNSQLKGK